MVVSQMGLMGLFEYKCVDILHAVMYIPFYYYASVFPKGKGVWS